MPAWMLGNRNTFSLLVGVQTSEANIGISLEIPQNVKNRHTLSLRFYFYSSVCACVS